MNMKIDQHTDPMAYQPDMEITSSAIMEQVLAARAAYDETVYTADDVKQALLQDHLTPEAFAALLAPAAAPFLEQLAQRAQAETRKHFGNAVNLFTPLYIANYCENHCIYCGFNCYNNIKRAKLTAAEIETEMQAIAAQGLEEILILTGESPTMSDVQYIGAACRLARKYFRVVGLEVYPMDICINAELTSSPFSRKPTPLINTVRCIWADVNVFSPIVLMHRNELYRAECAELALPLCWDWMIFAVTLWQQVCMLICSNVNTLRPRSLFPVRACAPSSTMSRSIPKTSMSGNCCRSSAPTASLCPLPPSLFPPVNAPVSAIT